MIISKWNKINSEKKSILVLLIILIIGSVVILFWNDYKENALSKSRITWAVVDDITLTKGGYSIDVHFFHDSELEHIDNIEQLDNCLKKGKIGDTVTIKYSLTDVSIAQIIHCYWNSRDTIAN